MDNVNTQMQRVKKERKKERRNGGNKEVCSNVCGVAIEGLNMNKMHRDKYYILGVMWGA